MCIESQLTPCYQVYRRNVRASHLQSIHVRENILRRLMIRNTNVVVTKKIFIVPQMLQTMNKERYCEKMTH